MRYEVIDDDGAPSDSDALAIASMLGLDENIIRRARWFLTKGGV
jgi:dsDNA-specific endonuclease/ATPase MutS2